MNSLRLQSPTAFSHFHNVPGSITGIAPLSGEIVGNLVPHLGVIPLFEGIGVDDNNSNNSDPKLGSFSSSPSNAWLCCLVWPWPAA